MRPSTLYFFPLALPFVLALFAVIVLVITLIEVGLLRYAYEKMGVSRRYVFFILFLSLFGSYVNIPVAYLPDRAVVSGQPSSYFGMHYGGPVVYQWPGTVIALNLGGAIIPTLLSLYLLGKHRLFLRGFFAVIIVATAVHAMAHPIRGMGIAVPIFVPPLVAAAVALLLSRSSAPSLAYIAGSLGTLIGGDLLNLDKVQGLGSPLVSIGGAGTFDGIFLTGILAVILA